jgi:cytochrome c peroxidase
VTAAGGSLVLCASAFFARSGKPSAAAVVPPVIELAAAIEAPNEPIQPLPNNKKFDDAKVTLGKKLFHDKRLSHDNSIACAGCHALDKGGTDQKDHSVGIGGAIGGINAPSVYNSGLNFKQFWNGRAATLEDQVNGPTHHPKEMGSNWDEILGKLRADAELTTQFSAIYPDGVQAQNVRDAIATFERSLMTVDSPFDRYLRGDASALSADAKDGYKLFKAYGCGSCHQGANVGGNMYQHMGVMKNYFSNQRTLTDADLGRFTVTGKESDRYVFRVPSLRNIENTHPYFHDGSAQTLSAAIEVMAEYQLGRYIDVKDVAKIEQFLKSLTGKQESPTL